MEAIAAIRNDIITAGPAWYLLTFPANTYTPTPRVLPMPRAVKSNVVRHLARRLSVRTVGEIGFFLEKVL